MVESLEGRELLAASLAPIGAITVPATLGYQVPLNGSGGGATTQNFTVQTSNPDIKATVAQGKFLTLTISHTAADAKDITFNGSLTFQLFDDLTPLTTSRIESFVTSGFYNSKAFHRIAGGFPTATDFIIQGGSANGFGTGFSGQPGAPFVDEFNQQLAFTGTLQLAMANAGPDTNDTQFFITTGSPRFLDFKHTVFAQLVADPQNIIPKMTQVELEQNPQVGLGNPNAPKDFPVSKIQINSAALSNTNPNGVIHVDATRAKAGETSTVTVTANDPATSTKATRSFSVNVAANTQNERAFLKQLPYPSKIVTTTPGTTTNPAVVYTQHVAVNQKDIFILPAVDPEGDKLTYTVQAGLTTSATGTQSFVPIPATQGTATVDQATGIVTVTPAQGFTGDINLLVGVRDQTNRAASGATADDPANFDWHQIILNVSGTTPTALTPIALPVTQTVAAGNGSTIQLNGQSANPSTSTGLTYNLVSQPANGTISQFNASTGSLVYTPATNFEGTDSFQYTVTDKGTGTTNLTSPPATVSLTITQAATGAVRQIGNVLVITPAPRTDGGTNTIAVTQINDATDATKNKLQVTINGIIDATQPLVSDINRIVVFGAKASDDVTIDPSVSSTIRVTLDGGHGGTNVLQAGAGSTREHGWFGRNTLIGGTGPNQLVGRQGHVKFRPTATTNEIFAGQGHPPRGEHHASPPTGTFFKFQNGRLVPIPTPHPRHGLSTHALQPGTAHTSRIRAARVPHTGVNTALRTINDTGSSGTTTGMPDGKG